MSISVIMDDMVTTIDSYGKCPACGSSWDNGDIFERLSDLRESGDEFYKNKTDAELQEIAGHYGWTPDNPKRFSRVIGVELPYSHPQHYDGVSFWRCPDCQTQWPRAFFPQRSST